MGERRFVVDDVDNAAISIITESELKRRLLYISQYVPGVDRAIDILLHGEGEKAICRAALAAKDN